ncbi:MAG: hypothetical protein J6Y38_04705, partial [Bacteroidaceae bacterium]|nr:hypothetical protein [Bacteroidaceae bacterium]
FGFSEATLATVRQKGIVLQGHGIRLSKVAIATPSGITTIVGEGTMANAPVYTIDGRQTSRTLPGHLYIQKGKKFIAR